MREGHAADTVRMSLPDMQDAIPQRGSPQLTGFDTSSHQIVDAPLVVHPCFDQLCERFKMGIRTAMANSERSPFLRTEIFGVAEVLERNAFSGAVEEADEEL